MDELQFQHEQDPRLKEEAAAALNRTLWIQHWERERKFVRVETIVFTLYLSVGAAFAFISLMNFNWSPNVTVASLPYVLVLYLTVVIALFSTLIRYLSRVSPTRPDHVIKRPNYFWYWLMILMIVGNSMDSLIFGKDSPWILLRCAPAFLFAFGSDWRGMRKLRKNMINWGLIEPNGKTLLQSSPMAAQVSEAEAAIDSALGKPKRKRFRKAIMSK